LTAGVGFLGLVLAERRLRHTEPLTLGSILWVGLVLRLLVLPIEPSLSNDVYRYLWDGKVIAEGFNPYRLAPEDPTLETVRDDLWPKLSHTNIPTVYPPLVEAIFWLVDLLPAPLWSWKLLLAGVDLSSCLLLLAVLTRRRQPLSRSIWYIWNPLVTLEITAMGHLDGLGIAAMLSTFVLLQAPFRKLGAGSLSAASAVFVKIIPILALPIFARVSGKPIRFLAVTGGLVLVTGAPIVWSVRGIPPGLLEYAVSWEFNGPLFEPLWRTIDGLDLEDQVSRALDAAKEISGRHDFWNRFYPFNYPQFLAKLLLAVGLSFSVVVAWRNEDAAVGLRALFGSILIFSATVYPWYLLWVLPWAVITNHRAWLLLSYLLMLSYLPQFSDLPLFPWVFASIWIPFAGAMFLCRRQPTH